MCTMQSPSPHRASTTDPRRRVPPDGSVVRTLDAPSDVTAADHKRHRRQGSLERFRVYPQADRRTLESIVRGFYHRRTFSIAVVFKADVADCEHSGEKTENFVLTTQSDDT